jgi:CRP-like cAMP-binding protein
MISNPSSRSNTHDIRSSVRVRNSLINKLSNEVYWLVRDELEPISVRKGQILVHPGSLADTVYFPESAVFSERIQISRSLEAVVEIGLIGHEGAVGLIQAYCGTANGNLTVALKAGTALRIPTRKLLDLMFTHGELRSCVGQYFQDFSRCLCQRPACSLFHSSKERFCTWLLAYLEKSNSQTLRATHGEIAACLGVHRPQVTLMTQDLRDDGAIACGRGSLTILDQSRLVSSACSCHEIQTTNRSHGSAPKRHYV